MRHFHIGILGVVAVVAIATLLLSVSYVPVFTPLAVSITPYARITSGVGNTVIVNLDIGEYISGEIDAVGESQLSGLRGGSISGRDFSASYVQSIRFSEPGLFDGCFVKFGRDEQNRVTDFLECDDSVFKYTVDFSPGLESRIDGSSLPDIEDEEIDIMGDDFTIVRTYVDTGKKNVELRMFGGYGSIDLKDNNYGDDLYTDGGAIVNGQAVRARVKIKASSVGDKLSIYSIQYLLDADALVGGNVQVNPLHCVREYLQYPTGMLSPNFDICYKGLSAAAVVTDPVGISGNEVRVRAAGDDEYVMVARNLIGNLYNIPLAQLPGSYGNKGRKFVFVEAANAAAPNINVNDYLLVNSRNDIQGVSNVLMFKGVVDNIAYFDDLATGSRKASVDIGTGEGQLMVGEGTYRFVVTANQLAMDQNNDGQINGGEANFVLPGGTRVDFGPGFTVRVITPSRLFSNPEGDEITKFNIVFGSFINLVVPSPQATLPSYSFVLQGEGGGIYKGMTKYGILFTYDKEDSTSSDLRLIVPGSQARAVKGGAGAEVYITLERSKLMKQPQVPAAPARCGDAIITKPEYCDPPGSPCADQFRRSGKCSADCLSCEFTPPTVCGNKLLEKNEQCESAGDCPVNSECISCKCVALPPPVCGNKLLEKTEQCEADADCPIDYVCSNCICFPAPPVQAPAVNITQEPNVFAKFFMWLAKLFGA